ncbi:hypothetical protein F0562_004088 [Nyssa sinensis]|uniref:Homeobox domain-containing protein n=1 Tax=Nyssa sinensis TaxID=561372 RepID=A0A5J5BXM9_9ASTE|nr:hypothetical protein F0562_004088 [Nyssa sinensis]
MDFGQGSNVNGSGDDPEASDSRKGKKLHHRHDVHQIQQLEAYFKEFPHPDENQRLQLSKELGLEPKQVKFWFQNKRTQIKFLNERADSSALRVENGRIQSENNTFRQALNNALCSACSDPHFDKEERRRSVEKLRKENAHLKQEHERLSNIVAKFIGKPVYPTQSMLAAPASSLDLPAEGVWALGMAGPSLDLDLDIVSANPNDPILAHQLNGIQEMDKSLLVETAASAMDELMKLLQVNEPVWIKSPAGERYVLQGDSYGKFFPGANHLKSSGTRIVSSKSSGVVMMNGMHLLGMFLDSSKWVDLFPTIVTQARTVEVLDTGMLGNQGASLQLMYVQMHILSPLVVPREFYFLRYCRQLEPGTWVVVDLPYDCSKVNPPTPPLNYWGLPSGCMIQDMSNGYSMVTWVEHVEVDYKSLNHRLYTELVQY